MTADDLNRFDAVVDAFGAWTPETLPQHSTTLISPACDFQADGERTGKYIIGGEELTLNAAGENVISYAEYDVVMVDEILNGNNIQKRISVVKA